MASQNHDALKRLSRAARERRDLVTSALHRPDKPPICLEGMTARVTPQSLRRAELTRRAKRVKVTLAPVSL